MNARLIVCDTCRYSAAEKTRGGRTGGAMLAALARQAATGRGVEVVTRSCLMGCDRHCNVAIQAPGKLTYVLGRFAPVEESAAAILDWVEKYAASETGQVPYREWPQGVKGHFVARIPPLGEG